jgi:hypothetical protein
MSLRGGRSFTEVTGNGRRASRRRSRGGCLVLLAALAVALLAGGAAAGGRTPRTIPWLDEQPQRAPAQSPLAPPCRAGDLRAALFLQGATGSLVGGVTLTNAGRPCALLGWAGVSFAGAAARSTHWQVRRVKSSREPPDPLADPPGSLRALAHGKSARVALVWSNWCGPGSSGAGSSGARPVALVLALAGGTRVRLPLTRAPRCDSPARPSRISAEPFRPFLPQLPPSSRLPLRLAVAGPRPIPVSPGRRALRAQRGTLLRFRIAVTNAGPDPYRFGARCPAYVEQLAGSAPRPYLLNCRQAGMIEPGHSLLFELALPVAAAARLGSSELTFQLAPRTFEAPIVQAPVWVVR